MSKAADAAGVQTLTSTPAVDLVMDGGVACGVVAQQEDGSYLQVNAKAVILATGGSEGNEEMRLAHGRGDELTSFYCGGAGETGDGLRMAVKAGALDTTYAAGFVDQPFLSEMCNSAEWNFSADSNPLRDDDHPIWDIVKNGNALWVNEAAGNPETGLATWAVETIVAQERRFVLIDEERAQRLGQDSVDILFNNNAHGTKFKADTLEELAQEMGFDPQTLSENVERYNDICASGEDTDFGKCSDMLNPIGDGPYYAFRLSAIDMCSVGGIRVNRDMQRADATWNVIPGLYAIGVDSMPIYPSMYYFNMPGSGIAFEIHSGLVAARNAAAAR